jgi:hypothetical protein
VRQLVQRRQGAAARRPARGVRRIAGRPREVVQQRDPPANVLGACVLGPVVVEPRAQLGRLQRIDLVQVARDGAQRDGRARRDDRVVAEGPAQRPDGGAQVGPRVRRVGPEAGGQRVALVRALMQREEGEQPPVRKRQGHRSAVAHGRDLAEQLHPQHRLEGIRTSRSSHPTFRPLWRWLRRRP